MCICPDSHKIKNNFLIIYKVLKKHCRECKATRFKELKIRTEHWVVTQLNYTILLLSNRFTKFGQSLDNNHPGIGQEIWILQSIRLNNTLFLTGCMDHTKWFWVWGLRASWTKSLASGNRLLCKREKSEQTSQPTYDIWAVLRKQSPSLFSLYD